ncbi:MAG: 3-hydroxyacyl-ACP dehydratase FabZ [Vulcanimicrobiota bacterium]
MIDCHEILQILPHRYPFILVDKILELEDDKRAVGLKNVTINEPFFQGHFPELPTMPGVLIAEAAAQVGGIMLMASRRNQDLVPYLAGINKMRWRKPVYPGDQLIMTVEMVGSKGKYGKVQGKTEVNGKRVAHGEMLFALMPRNEIK